MVHYPYWEAVGVIRRLVKQHLPNFDFSSKGWTDAEVEAVKNEVQNILGDLGLKPYFYYQVVGCGTENPYEYNGLRFKSYQEAREWIGRMTTSTRSYKLRLYENYARGGLQMFDLADPDDHHGVATHMMNVRRARGIDFSWRYDVYHMEPPLNGSEYIYVTTGCGFDAWLHTYVSKSDPSGFRGEPIEVPGDFGEFEALLAYWGYSLAKPEEKG